MMKGITNVEIREKFEQIESELEKINKNSDINVKLTIS